VAVDPYGLTRSKREGLAGLGAEQLTYGLSSSLILLLGKAVLGGLRQHVLQTCATRCLRIAATQMIAPASSTFD
jgi:hypothetical protein